MIKNNDGRFCRRPSLPLTASSRAILRAVLGVRLAVRGGLAVLLTVLASLIALQDAVDRRIEPISWPIAPLRIVSNRSSISCASCRRRCSCTTRWGSLREPRLGATAGSPRKWMRITAIGVRTSIRWCMRALVLIANTVVVALLLLVLAFRQATRLAVLGS